MKFLLKRENLGTKKYDIVINDDGTWCQSQKQNRFNAHKKHLTIPSREYQELRKLYKLPYRSFPPRRFVKAYQTVLYPEDERKAIGVPKIPWKQAIPRKLYKKELKLVVDGLISDFKDLDTSYYFDTYQKQSIVFESLQPAAINVDKFEHFLKQEKETTSQQAILKSFSPVISHDGIFFAPRVEYDRLSSITGRLTIKSGPGILHLKKEYRNILCSRWGDEGNVYYLDYRSLEPRLLLSLKNDSIVPKDIYMHAAESLGVNASDERDYIKTAIISMIYGAGDKELVKQLKGHVSHPEDFISSIKEYFGVEKLRSSLKKEYKNNNGKCIYNLYGRPIFAEKTPPYVLVNYFIQSTAVDVALYGFSNIVDRLIKSGTDLVKPIFVLHDALIVDVHKSIEHLLPKISKAGSKHIPKLEDTTFWINVECLK